MRFLLLAYLSLFISSVAYCQQSPQLQLVEDRNYSLEELFSIMNSQDFQLVFSSSVIRDKSIFLSQGMYSVSRISEKLEEIGIRLLFQSGNYLVIKVPVNHLISGFVYDMETGNPLIGASIILDKGKTGTITNNYGYYTLQIPPGKHLLEVYFIGYKAFSDSIELLSNEKQNFYLNELIQELDEVVVTDAKKKELLFDMVPGKHVLNYEEKGQIPYFLGEVDILQESLLLPGITSVGEDASGINIRGGDIDQNLFLLDEATIYNPNHFYGLISVFNPEAVNQVNVMKGYIPPAYGGRASSVVSIYQREGDYNSLKVSGGIGLVSARTTLEGPIIKEKSSFLVSARQSLLDLSLDQNTPNNNSRTSFQDLNAKVNFKLNDRNTFFLSGYFGNDRNRAGFDAVRNWGNRALTFRWNHTFGPRLFSNTSLVLSEYNYRITNPVEAGSFIGRSQIIDYGIKNRNYFYASPKSTFEFGLNLTYHRLLPGERIPFDENSSQTEPLILDSESGVESQSFISHEYSFSERVKVQYGLSLNRLSTFGSGEEYNYIENLPKSDNTITDTVTFDNWDRMFSFNGLEPRISINLGLTENSSLKPSYIRMYQFLHLVSNTAAPSPTDIWKLSGKYIPPIRSDQFSLGFYQYLFENKWEVVVETYYKSIKNLIDYKNNADLLFNPNLETELLIGDGRAYGLEFFIQKTTGKLHGWVSYTLSRSERKVSGPFEEETINGGEFYPEDFDKTHNLSFVGIYEVNNRLSFSGSFNFTTGRPITLPSGKYFFNGTLVPHFEGRNQNRIPNYHRLDISAKLLSKRYKKDGTLKKYRDYWTFSIYNLYARENVYSYFFRQNEDNPNITEIQRFSIFGTIIPSVTYNFSF